MSAMTDGRAEYDRGYRSIMENLAGVYLPHEHDGRLSADRRAEKIARYREVHPNATEAEVYQSLDYEDYRRAIAEQKAVLDLRAKTIAEQRGVIAALRDLIGRIEAHHLAQRLKGPESGEGE